MKFKGAQGKWFIENLNELGLKGKRKERFVNFYYNNLDMNLLDALDKFKHQPKSNDI